jgi:hypothetical protein
VIDICFETNHPVAENLRAFVKLLQINMGAEPACAASIIGRKQCRLLEMVSTISRAISPFVGATRT